MKASPEEKQKMVEDMQKSGVLKEGEGVESLNVEKLQEMFNKTKAESSDGTGGPRVIRP
jgi:hypothetical protein